MSEPDLEMALRYAWDWFALHAAQRMQVLNFFFLMIALVVAGFGTAYGAGSYAIAGGISSAGVLLTLVFWRLDVRGRELIRAAERPLKRIEAKLAELSSVKSIRIVKKVAKPLRRWTSFTFAIRSFMLIAALAFSALSILSFAHGGENAVCTQGLSFGNDGISISRVCGNH